MESSVPNESFEAYWVTIGESVGSEAVVEFIS